MATIALPLARFTDTGPRESAGAGPFAPTRRSTVNERGVTIQESEWPSVVYAVQVYGTPSASTLPGTVQDGVVWHPDCSTTPDLPSPPVATWKQYFTTSPASASVTGSTASVGVVEVIRALSATAAAAGTGAGTAVLYVPYIRALATL